LKAFQKRISVGRKIRWVQTFEPWTLELYDELTIMYFVGVNSKEMAKRSGRASGAILSRIRKLELEELYG